MDEGGPQVEGDDREPAPLRGSRTPVLDGLRTLAFAVKVVFVIGVVASVIVDSRDGDSSRERDESLASGPPVCAGAEDGVATGQVDIAGPADADDADDDDEETATPAGPLTWQCHDQEGGCTISFELPWTDGWVESADARVSETVGDRGNYAYGRRGTKVTFPVVVDDGRAECTGPRVTYWPPD